MTERGQYLLPALALLLAACSVAPQTPEPRPTVEEAEIPGSATRDADAPVRTEPEAARLPDDARAELRFTLAAVGDMMLGTDYPDDRLPDDDAVGFLAAVTEPLLAADLAFGNLEGVLVDGGEPAKQCSNPHACYLFRSPTRYAERFRAAGFDALSLANNHALDFGEEGRGSSMEALSSAGIVHSGREGDFGALRLGDLSVGFVAFSVTRDSNLLHDYALARSIVSDQAALHDLLVVSFHGGAEGDDAARIPFGEEEYFGEPRGDVVRFAREMVEAGADFVFGHGPHLVRGMERYGDRLIVYSLGNFATYYGISVSGDKGVAPILLVTIDGYGRFLEGRVISAVQLRPGGPQPDPQGRALQQMRELSFADFREPGLRFLDDGRVLPDARHYVRPTAAPRSER
ncbi:MAG: CapA family protein [Gammaproteobacteria bacterium]|nr:CapA family protein [Gammaproteobacteria bacterium]MDH4254179.1 CapA family protein [Gammaproteobacteria bacterium]MDH5309973.1 CapA family protein [Gammaproteobacteria bacterium]